MKTSNAPTLPPPTPPLPPAERWLARHVIADGADLGLATVRMAGGVPVAETFTGETPSTAYVDGTIIIENNQLSII